MAWGRAAKTMLSGRVRANGSTLDSVETPLGETRANAKLYRSGPAESSLGLEIFFLRFFYDIVGKWWWGTVEIPSAFFG